VLKKTQKASDRAREGGSTSLAKDRPEVGFKLGGRYVDGRRTKSMAFTVNRKSRGDGANGASGSEVGALPGHDL